nr:hypothetical protein [Rarobacter incanus]
MRSHGEPMAAGALSADHDYDRRLVRHLVSDPLLDGRVALALDFLPLLRIENGLAFQCTHLDDLLHSPRVTVVVEAVED